MSIIFRKLCTIAQIYSSSLFLFHKKRDYVLEFFSFFFHFFLFLSSKNKKMQHSFVVLTKYCETDGNESSKTRGTNMVFLSEYCYDTFAFT